MSTEPQQVRTIDQHEWSVWLRGRVADIRTRHRVKAIRPCQHLRRDDVGYIDLGDPTRALCITCATNRWTGTEEDTTCDRCRERSPDGLWTAIVVPHSEVAVRFGLCDACWTKEVGPDRATAS